MMTPRKILASALPLVVLIALNTRPVAQTLHPKGTTMWNPAVARNGLTFIAAPDGTARLINMQGQVINTWAVENDLLLYKVPILSSPGHILAFRGPIAIEGYARARGSIITEYDYSGRPVWEYVQGATLGPFPFGGFHHDLLRLENGNTIAMASVLVTVPSISPKQLIDDCLIELNPLGQIVWPWCTFEHFDEFGFTDAAKEEISNDGGDWAHANAVSVVPPNDLGDPRFRPGNLVISYRQLNTVVVVDKITRGIVWRTGPNNSLTIGQHHAQMIPQGREGAGRLLAFDNGGSAGYPAKFRDFSRVVEIDPLSNSLPWTYSATRSGFVNWSFFSSIVSSAQRLGGGNTLITEGTKGRIFEIASNGDIVWEYMSPFTDVTTNTGRPVVSYLVYRAYRLPFYWPFFPAPPNGGV